MADLDINIGVKGASQVPKLRKELDKLSKSTQKVNKTIGIAKSSLFLWTAGLTAGALAIKNVIDLGADHLKQLEETNGTIIKTTELEDDLATSMGMVSGALLEHTGAWEAYRETLIGVSNFLDIIAGKEALLAQARAESIIFERELQKMLTEDIEKRLKATDKQAKADLSSLQIQQRMNREYEASQAKKQQLIKDTAMQSEKAYEAELIALDASIDATNKKTKAVTDLGTLTDAGIDSVNAETDAFIANSQAMQEAEKAAEAAAQQQEELQEEVRKATEEIRAQTEAVADNNSMLYDDNGNFKATKSNTGQTFQSSGETSSGTEAYARHAMGMNLSQPTSAMDRYLREIAESSQDTNDAVRGY